MKKIYAVSAAALTAMALVPTAVSFATENEAAETVDVTYTVVPGDVDLNGWYYRDWATGEFNKMNGASFTIKDVAVSGLATFGLNLAYAGGDEPTADWSNVTHQTADVKFTVDGAKSGDKINVTVTIGEAGEGLGGKVSYAVTTEAKVAPASTTPATTTPGGENNTDTGVEGVAAVIGVAAVAAGAMVVAKKRK